MKTRIILAVAMAAGLAAPAALAQQSKPNDSANQCFWSRNITSFAPQGREIVNLRVGVRDYYQLKLLGPCGDIDWNQAIGVRSRGSDFICSNLDAEIISPSQIGPQRCPVTSVRKLTDAEVAALPKKSRP